MPQPTDGRWIHYLCKAINTCWPHLCLPWFSLSFAHEKTLPSTAKLMNLWTVSKSFATGFAGKLGLNVFSKIYWVVFAVRHFDQSMAHDLEGLAGVATGEDAFAHILCGATAVQVGDAGQYRKHPLLVCPSYFRVTNFRRHPVGYTMNMPEESIGVIWTC